MYTKQAFSGQNVPVITNDEVEFMDLQYSDIPRQFDTLNSPSVSNLLQPSSSTHQKFRCDGREYCSQMRSCEEATFFIQNCPNTKMDGDHDGVPCERQWCN